MRTEQSTSIFSTLIGKLALVGVGILIGAILSPSSTPKELFQEVKSVEVREVENIVYKEKIIHTVEDGSSTTFYPDGKRTERVYRIVDDSVLRLKLEEYEKAERVYEKIIKERSLPKPYSISLYASFWDTRMYGADFAARFGELPLFGVIGFLSNFEDKHTLFIGARYEF